MNQDHEIAFMYAPSPWGIFQPRFNPYSPFGNVVLRVVRPPRPTLEDLVLQLLGPTDEPAQHTDALADPQVQDLDLGSSESTPNYDLSEMMARELQEQEDREQAMRDRSSALQTQFEEFMSIFGAFKDDDGGVANSLRKVQTNAEAGPSVKREVSKATSSSGLTFGNLRSVETTSENDHPVSDASDKKSGKRRARQTGFDPTSYSPLELLENLEASMRHEINKFNFPEHLDFQHQDASVSPTPILLGTPYNADVHAFEKALMELRVNLDLMRDVDDASVMERRLQLDGRIRRELEDLDKRVLEAWAARRRYSPSLVPDSS